MDKINASLSRMEQVFVLGFPALFTPHRVSRATVHLGLCCYELQGSLEEPELSVTLLEEASRDFCGTLLTAVPILPAGVSQLTLLPGDILWQGEEIRLTPAEFEERYFA